jgi:hypothetical protein
MESVTPPREQLIQWWRREQPPIRRIRDFTCTISAEDLASLLCWKLDGDIDDRREFVEAFVRIGEADPENRTSG